MPEKRLPPGALSAATWAVLNATGSADSDEGRKEAHRLARAALEAAMPDIERTLLRSAAARILELDAADQQCTVNKGPYWDMRTCLRKLSRGEKLPVPGEESTHG